MSGSVNKVILVGNLGADPELRHTQSGTAVCDIRLATNKKWKDKSGELKEKTEWHRVVLWDKRGEVAAKWLKKGQQVYIEGEMQTRDWEDKDGNKRYTTEVVATDMQFIGSKGDGDGDKGGGRSSSSGNDDIPF